MSAALPTIDRNYDINAAYSSSSLRIGRKAMSDEPTPEAEVQEAQVEVKPGKKAKADKKKPIEPSQPEGDQAAPVEASGAIEPPPDAESSPAIKPAAAEAAPSDRDDDVFQQGIQALLRGEYDAADNLFGQALTAYRKQGDQSGQIDVLEQLGHLCFLRGAEAQAREYYQQANLMRVA
jgi:hypothetical protein